MIIDIPGRSLPDSQAGNGVGISCDLPEVINYPETKFYFSADVLSLAIAFLLEFCGQGLYCFLSRF